LTKAAVMIFFGLGNRAFRWACNTWVMKGLETPERLVDSPYFFGGYLPLPIVIYLSCSFLDSQSQENQTSGQTKQMYLRYPFPFG